MALTKQDIAHCLGTVQVAGTNLDLVAAGILQNVAICDGHVSLRLARAGAGGPSEQDLRESVTAAVKGLGQEIKQVNLEFAGQPVAQAVSRQPTPAQARAQVQAQAAASPRPDNPLPQVRYIVAVGAGKGGVGKSTVAVNLAVGLARKGMRVGLLDADIYGPSAPTLLGLDSLSLHGSQDKFFPFQVHGIKAITMGKLVEADKPLIWRGPMAHKAFHQLALQTEWGQLDYLIVDLPPGTGDVPLTMAQTLPLAGAVIVCTPQKVAQDDAVRAVAMFKQLNVEVLGVVENMSYFLGDDAKVYDLFGRGGAATMAHRLGLDLLGEVPIYMALRTNSDSGNPTANFEGNEKLAADLNLLVDNLLKAIQNRSTQAQGPTLTIH